MCVSRGCTRVEVAVLGKVRLFVRVRAQGCRIESVPLKRLVELASYRKKRWEDRKSVV